MKNNSTTVGQFYAINVDNEKPYNVYGGLQDNGVWKGAHNAQQDERWHSTGHNPWTSIMGGDGMKVKSITEIAILCILAFSLAIIIGWT